MNAGLWFNIRFAAAVALVTSGLWLGLAHPRYGGLASPAIILPYALVMDWGRRNLAEKVAWPIGKARFSLVSLLVAGVALSLAVPSERWAEINSHPATVLVLAVIMYALIVVEATNRAAAAAAPSGEQT